jgi:ribose-phosphate pyrophosphokinase
MENYNRGKLGIISCESGKHFALKVVKNLQRILAEEDNYYDSIYRKSKETEFANTEIKTEIDESIRNQDIYIFQDCENKSKGMSVNDNFMVLKTAINAAKLSDAHKITAVMPYFPYSRQERQKTRECITAAMVARELEDAGATDVITLDLHNDAIKGFFRTAQLQNLRAYKAIIEYINTLLDTENMVINAPDVGGAARANFHAKRLGMRLSIINKERDYSKPNTVDKMRLIGYVRGKNVFSIDDMIDTAGTVVNSAKELKSKKAKKVYFAASLALFNKPAVKRIDDAYKEGLIDKVIGTDVIYRSRNFKQKHPWYDQISLADYFAQVIYSINKNGSISSLLE